MRNFKHMYIELYKHNIYYALCSGNRYINRVKDEFGTIVLNIEHSVGRFRVYYKDNDPIGVIWVRDKKDICSIAHECFHAACWILADRGISLTDESEEAYAYLQQFLLKKILQNYTK